MPGQTTGAEQVHAIRATPRALAWLAATTSGEVLHVFDAAAYAVNAGGDVLALTAEHLGAGPLSLVIPTPIVPLTEWISAGAQVRVDGEDLQAGRLHVRLAGADSWDPNPGWQRLVPHRARLASRWEQLKDTALRHRVPDSLASLLEPENPDHAAKTTSEQLQAAARDAAGRLLAALPGNLDGGKSSLPAMPLAEAARALAGLGTGFTPAGDDFLLGVMYAVWSTCPPQQARAVSDSLAEAAAPHTTRVSAAWLRAGAEGEAGDSWHALVAALLQEDWPAVETAIAGLARIGHTSGADALAGFLLGLKAILRPPSPAS
jgi:hypothetical protein